MDNETNQSSGAAAPFRLYEPVLSAPAVSPRPVAVGAWRGGLVIRATNWLGDTFMALPALYRLRGMLPPGAGLFVLCSDKLAPIWRCMPWVDEVIPFSGSRVDKTAHARLKELNPGAALVLPNSFGAAWDLFGLSIPVRAGRAGRMRSLLLTDLMPQLPSPIKRRNRHQLCEYLELVSLFGEVPWRFETGNLKLENGETIPESRRHGVTASPFEIENRKSAIGNYLTPAPVNPGDASVVFAKLGVPCDRPILALAPGAAYGPAKQWPAANFHAVARWWTARGGRVLVVGAPKEVTVGDEVLAGIEGGMNVAGKTSVAEMMALLGGCRALVSNDSGAMHLAAAAGVPGVGLFGSTSAVATGPLGGRWVILEAEEKPECSPCFGRACKFTGADCRCLNAIHAERACAALEWLLGEET